VARIAAAAALQNLTTSSINHLQHICWQPHCIADKHFLVESYDRQMRRHYQVAYGCPMQYHSKLHARYASLRMLL
jgi:hypothetical protein